MQQRKLMIPGPVDVPDEVLETMGAPCMPHYGAEWLQLYFETITELKQVFGTQNDVFIMPGPGSAALEAAVGSMLTPGEKMLVLVHGYFSQRLGTIARACGIETVLLEAPWGQPILPEQVQQALDADPAIKAVGIVHHETSTGVLNPLQAIVEVVHAHGLPAVVDAVSSVGGVPVPVDEWGIECCVTVANKCLDAPPGLAMISVSPRAWEIITSKADRTRGWLLNLNTWKACSDDWEWHPYPTTMPTNNIAALHTSLQHILAEGLETRYARYAAVSTHVRDALCEIGLQPFVPDAYASPLVTAIQGSPELPADELVCFLRDEYGILVGGGIGPLKGKILRVGHMGKAMTDEYADAFLHAALDFVVRKKSALVRPLIPRNEISLE